MKNTHSRLPQSDLKLAAGILRQIQNTSPIGARMRLIANRFRGLPYVRNPLIGDAVSPELFTVSLKEFDCVTYMETVLALALTRSVEEFLDLLRRLRYKNGVVEWRCRNHYMSDWIRNNARIGVVENLTRGANTVTRSKSLDLIQGLCRRQASVRCFPKRRFTNVTDQARDGDLIFFVSTKKHLDVFHTGILFRDESDGRILLNHASRSRGGVVEQPLVDFLKENRMAGYILIRPVEKKAAPQKHTKGRREIVRCDSV
jgi:hypothetical protein